MVIVRDGKEEINEILLKNENIYYKVEKYFIKMILYIRLILIIFFMMCFIW